MAGKARTSKPSDRTRALAATESLAALQGLGPRSAEMLVRAGIASPSALRSLGAVRAFVRVREAGLRPSLNLLWALEGAIRGVRWQDVARADRMRLLLEVDDASRAG